MDEPMTKPSGSKPASPSSTYSETDRSEVNTPVSSAPAVCASLVPAACGSQVAELALGWLRTRGVRELLRIRQLSAGCPAGELLRKHCPAAGQTRSSVGWRAGRWPFGENGCSVDFRVTGTARHIDGARSHTCHALRPDKGMIIDGREAGMPNAILYPMGGLGRDGRF